MTNFVVAIELVVLVVTGDLCLFCRNHRADRARTVPSNFPDSGTAMYWFLTFDTGIQTVEKIHIFCMNFQSLLRNRNSLVAKLLCQLEVARFISIEPSRLTFVCACRYTGGIAINTPYIGVCELIQFKALL